MSEMCTFAKNGKQTPFCYYYDKLLVDNKPSITMFSVSLLLLLSLYLQLTLYACEKFPSQCF